MNLPEFMCPAGLGAHKAGHPCRSSVDPARPANTMCRSRFAFPLDPDTCIIYLGNLELFFFRVFVKNGVLAVPAKKRVFLNKKNASTLGP